MVWSNSSYWSIVPKLAGCPREQGDELQSRTVWEECSHAFQQPQSWLAATACPGLSSQVSHSKGRGNCRCFQDQRCLTLGGYSSWKGASVHVSAQPQAMDEWFATVYALPTVWPDISIMGSGNLRKVVGHDLHEIRTKYQVPSMWGTIYPRWDLLKQHLMAWGPGYCTAEEREEWLFTNRSNKPGDDTKDEVQEDDAEEAWQHWTDEWNRIAWLGGR